ncbi:hypothetical protein GCM10027347_38670 [Larkinella harenae]
MKTLYVLLLLALPVGVWAQSEPLKPIEIVRYSEPVYTRIGFRPHYTSRYLYDGIEVRRATELGQYILASGDPNAIREYRQFKRGRDVGTGLMIAGGATSLVGMILTAIPKEVPGQKTVPPGLVFQNGAWYGNGMIFYGDPYAGAEPRKEIRKSGLITLSTGLTTLLIGSLIRRPGIHFRRSVQYYNKSLRTNDVSIRLEPQWNGKHGVLGVVARF